MTNYLSRHPELYKVGLFTLLYLGIATLFAFQYQNWEFVFYISVVVLQLVIVLEFHERVQFSRGVLWALSIWGLLHMIGGLLPVPEAWPINGDKRVFYSLWFIPGYLKYDHVIHAYGFATCTIVSWQALRTLLPNRVPSGGVVTLCVLAGMGLGAVNEIVEFMAVLLIPDTNVGGYLNTGWDLVFNGIGATLAGLVLYIRKA